MVEQLLAEVRIVLVEPAGPLNVGAIARVMKNMGLSQLVLVNPHCDWLGEEARLMAVHAANLLETAQRMDSIPEALKGCQRAIATTSRDRSPEATLVTPEQGLPWLLEASDPNANPIASALIFGPEDRGLSNIELGYAQRFVRIPSSPTYPSLNLAQAVAICCYELHQITLSKHPTPSPQLLAPSPPSLDLLEGYYQQLEALLLKIGYLYPHTAPSRMEKFRRLFNRAELSTEEVTMLRGILRQIEWALGRSNS
ncbi:MAG: RNA methyltransferase [Leptolyngbyaceae cyanobacterium SL_5_9]|nr:RNA methyltransferase [Leptolyngbyaceae cyanobacterium SL_5_9]NJO76280.1 RNA methyltransferase [Leptolyngbyaceae cyanobacterium RM1_406_9]